MINISNLKMSNIQYYKLTHLIQALYDCANENNNKNNKNAFETKLTELYDLVEPLYTYYMKTIKTIDKRIQSDIFTGMYDRPVKIYNLTNQGKFDIKKVTAGFLSATIDNRIYWINNVIHKYYRKNKKINSFINKLNVLTNKLTYEIRMLIKQCYICAENERKSKYIKKKYIPNIPNGTMFDSTNRPFVYLLLNNKIIQPTYITLMT